MLRDLSAIPPEAGSFIGHVQEEMNSTREYIRRNVREEKRSFAIGPRDLDMMRKSDSLEHYVERRFVETAGDLMKVLLQEGIIKMEKYEHPNGDFVGTIIVNVCRDPKELVAEVESMMEGLEQVYEEL